MRVEESQFSAGTACEPCQAMGHFCPAHNFNGDDDPACRPCLAGNPCSQRQVRKPEFDKAVASNAQTVVTKPSPARVDPLRGEKLAETLEQREAKPSLCAYCEKPRHRGVCAARHAALATTGTTFAAFIPPSPDESESAPEVPLAVPEEDEPPVEPIPAVTPEMRAAVKTLDPPPAGEPVFEVVSRSQAQLRGAGNDRYAELADRLRKLGTGDLLKVSFASGAKADSYGKNVSRRMAKYNLRVKYERHGAVLFLEVKQPISPTNEVPAL